MSYSRTADAGERIGRGGRDGRRETGDGSTAGSPVDCTCVRLAMAHRR
jgi:hypothetical protein